MARLTKGTIVQIDAAYREADLALREVIAFAISHPTVSPDNGAPELVKKLNRLRRVALGSKCTLVICDCCRVNPHVSANLRTECCGTSSLEVVA